MELLHGVSCIKGETHALVTLMRLNTRWSNSSSTASARRSSSNSYYDDDDVFITSFRQLNEYLEGLYDLQDVDCVRYVAPFHRIIVSQQASGPLTSAALSALSKFALYGFFNARFPRMTEAVTLVADCISRCVFEETDWESDELILMKLLELSTLCYRCDAGNLLSTDAAWDIYCTCLSIHSHYRASKILKTEAESALVHLTLSAFTRASMMVRSSVYHLATSDRDGDGEAEGEREGALQSPPVALSVAVDLKKGGRGHAHLSLSDLPGVTLLLLKILKAVNEMLTATHSKSSSSLQQRSAGAQFGLTLVNVALEAGGSALSGLRPVVEELRNDICRHLLRATQSEDLNVFALSLRVVFNLSMSIKEHMKVQLEVFLSSVHLRLLDGGGSAVAAAAAVAVSTSLAARDELVLESLLEFCREPALMQDLYRNYDCDVQCSNLFDAIISTLCRRSVLNLATQTVSGAQGVDSLSSAVRLTVLHKLAFDGLLAVLHSMTDKIHSGSEADAATAARESGESSAEDVANDHLRNELLLEKEIDRWCEIQVDHESEALPREGEGDGDEGFEVYSLVAHNAPCSPAPAARRASRSARSSSSQCSSPHSFFPAAAVDKHRRPSDGSLSSFGSLTNFSVVDREAECTSNAETRSKTAEALRHRKLLKQQIKSIAEQFNEKPLKQEWLRTAIQSRLIDTVDAGQAAAPAEREPQSAVEPRAVARFLKSIPGLGKTQIGEYISKGPADMFPFHALVLREYVGTFDFTDVQCAFDKSLRSFLSSFRLPGEAQCIDRIMEAFAGRFFEQLGPGKPFANADAVFILAFSTIMLNTDLHNPHISVSKKMSKDEFVRNNRGINDRSDLPREYLENIYDEIKANQIQVHFDVVDSKSTIDYSDSETWNKLMNRVANEQAPAMFTPTSMARRLHRGLALSTNANTQSLEAFSSVVDMFLVMAKPTFETIVVLWQHSADDQLLRRIVVGVFDYLQTCANLHLCNAFNCAIQVLFSMVTNHMMQSRGISVRPYSLSYILANRQSYQKWSRESGRDLKHLLQAPGRALCGLALCGEDEAEREPEPLDWTGASLVKSELLVRAALLVVVNAPLSLQKQTWSALFELLLWARSRGALPHDMSRVSTFFAAHGDQEREGDGEKDAFRYRPTASARRCYTAAFGLSSALSPADSSSSTKGGGSGSAGSAGGSWISFWWSGDEDADESSSSSSRSQAPLTLALLESAMAEDPDRIFSNANAAPCFDRQGLHCRTDDALLQMCLEHCALERLFLSLFAESSRRGGDAVLQGVRATLARVLERLLGGAALALDDAAQAQQWRDAHDEAHIPLEEVFPMAFLSANNADCLASCCELDAVLCLEWMARFVTLDDETWTRHRDTLHDLLQRIFQEENDVLWKKLPYFFERCVHVLFRCILFAFDVSPLPAAKTKAMSILPFYDLLRLLNDLPAHLLAEISGVVGAGVACLLRSLRRRESWLRQLAMDDWNLLLGLLSNIWVGCDGRARAWEVVSVLMAEDLVAETNYAAYKSLLCKFLDRNALVSQDWRNLNETERKRFRASQQEWASSAMLHLLRLALMSLGGYIKQRQTELTATRPRSHLFDAETAQRCAAAAAAAATVVREMFVFPDAHELKTQLFSPLKKDVLAAKSASHPAADAAPSPSQSSPLKAFHSATATAREREQSRWLTVPCVRAARPDEAAEQWADALSLLADWCGAPSLPLIHRALYCLEVLVGSGNIASLPMPLWLRALDELMAKMPLSLSAASLRLQGVSLADAQDTCVRCCNLLFHLLVLHIADLRRAEHFAAMFVRAMSAMAVNASVSAKTQSTHEEMLGMIIALLRLLRLPELQPPPHSPHSASKDSAAQTMTTSPSTEVVAESGSSSTGFLGVLQWMIAPAPLPLPTPQARGGAAPAAPPSLAAETTTSSSSGAGGEGKSATASQQGAGPVRLVSLDHDGALLALTWKSICTLYPPLPALVRTWDAQYARSLVQAVELVEQIKARGETSARCPSLCDAGTHSTEAVTGSAVVPPPPFPAAPSPVIAERSVRDVKSPVQVV